MTIDRAAMWREVMQIASIPDPIGSDEFDTREFVERSGLKWSSAVGALGRMISEGVIERRQALLRSGRRGYAYRLVTGIDDSDG